MEDKTQHIVEKVTVYAVSCKRGKCNNRVNTKRLANQQITSQQKLLDRVFLAHTNWTKTCHQDKGHWWRSWISRKREDRMENHEKQMPTKEDASQTKNPLLSMRDRPLLRKCSFQKQLALCLIMSLCTLRPLFIQCVSSLSLHV